MFKSWLTGLSVLILVWSPGAAETLKTVEINTEDIFADRLEKQVAVGDCEFIRDSGRPSVPFRKILFSADEAIESKAIYVRAVSSDTVELDFVPAENDPDLTTSGPDLEAVQPDIVRGNTACYPADPAMIVSQLKDGKRIWTVVYFPIQFLGQGKIIINRRVDIIAEDEFSGMIIEGLPKTEPRGAMPAFSKSPSDPPGRGCPLGHEFLVVTSSELAESFEGFLDLKIRTGFDAAMAVTDSIYERYGGIDEAEAIRNYLADNYLAGGRYVLLGGDGSHVPLRYAYYYNIDTLPDLDQQMICDLYFADYDGEWDTDGDGVWGEPVSDRPDLGAEVALGRLPFADPEQVMAYTEKLRIYLFGPGGDDSGYLNRSAFIVSDQMLDYFEDSGQHDYVAGEFPETFDIDLDQLVESPSGNDPSPTGPFAPEAVAALDHGFGLVNILAHGRPDGFILSSSEYNQYPKYYLLTGEEHIGNGAFDDLAPNRKIGFYYTIACEQASIDLDSVYSMGVPSVVEKLLDIDSAGAVGVIAFSRWGWVGSSYKFMAAFYRHLFGDAGGYPIEAMNLSYVDYPYYLDQIYGQNYYGDPSLRLYLGLPERYHIEAPALYESGQPVICRLSRDGQPVANHQLTVQIGDDDIQWAVSGNDGYVYLNAPETSTETIRMTVFDDGMVGSETVINHSIAADADDDDNPLPLSFELRQNYPNPFNPATTIAFTLTRRQTVSLAIYDILGRLVAMPIDGWIDAGEQKVTWDGCDRDGRRLPSGVYLYRLDAREGTRIRKMMLVK